MVLLLRYTGLVVSDVATLARDRVRNGRVYLRTMKGCPNRKGRTGNQSIYFGVGTEQPGLSFAA
jgi:hypothetical protein